MKRLFFPAILLCSVIGFALRPAPRKLLIYLPPLASFPNQLGAFHTVSDNNKVLFANPDTDGSVGLDRTYTNASGTTVDLYIAPQILGEHVPADCLNYAGSSILSLSKLTIPGDPAISANRLYVQDAVDNTKSTCVYYWRTANGSFAPDPEHSIRSFVWSWNVQQPGVLVRICMKAAPGDSGTEETLASLVRASYSQTGRLYGAIFPNTTK